MLVIRAEQIDLFGAARETAFRQELADLLATRFPEAAPDGPARLALVDQWRAEADAHDFSTRSQQRFWVQLRATHGAPLDTLPWAAPVLADGCLTPAEKQVLLDQRSAMVEAFS